MSGEDDVSAGARAMRVADAPFDALLQRLRADGPAGIAYETLRRRLVRFYRLHEPAEADDLADITLDRLARKIHEGTEVVSVPLYALGIARMVLHESRARGARRRIVEADPTLIPETEDAYDAEAAAENETVMAALSACLSEQDAAAGVLILAYYGADGTERIAVRQRLASELRISLNALRNRALRLREALEQCVRGRLGWPGPP